MFTVPVAAILSVGHMLFNIMSKMTALAQSRQVAETVVGFIMIHMRHSKHHFTPRNWVRFIIYRTTPLYSP